MEVVYFDIPPIIEKSRLAINTLRHHADCEKPANVDLHTSVRR